MGAFTPVMSLLTTPRALAALVLLFGLLAAQGGRGTMAYFTSTQVSASNVFTAGKVEIGANALSSGTGNVLTFTTGGIGTADCALSGTDVVGVLDTVQRMVPGAYCSGKVSIVNTSSVDAWLRMRVVRTDGATTGADKELNDKLRLYVRELTGGSPSTDTCNATVAVTTASAATPIVVTTATNHGLAAGARVNISGVTGNNAANGTFEVKAGTATATTFELVAVGAGNGLGADIVGLGAGTGGKLAAQWTSTSTSVFSPTNATTRAGLTEVTRGTGPANIDGIYLGGTADATHFGINATAVDTSEGNMSTTAINAVNLIGVDAANANNGTYNATLVGDPTTPVSRYFCVSLFLPSTSTLGESNTTGDNTVVGGTNTYAFVFNAAQKSGRP